MPKIHPKTLHPDEEMVKRTVRFFARDIERAKRFYPKLGYNILLRLLLNKHLDALEKKIQERERAIMEQDDLSLADVEVEIERESVNEDNR